MKKGNLYITPGSITRISADAIAVSTDRNFSRSGDGLMQDAFYNDIPEFAALFEDLRQSKQGEIQDSCSVFWMPLQQKRPYGIVVAIPTGSGIDPVKRSFQVVEQTLSCAREHLVEDHSTSTPRMIALPAFLTGKGGFWHDPYRVAVPQIEAAYKFIQENDIDVVFVTYAEHIYKAWIEARRNVVKKDDSSSVKPDENMVDTIKAGECALFIGSGLSINSGLPGWGTLIEDLSRDLDIPNDQNRSDMDYFLDLAQWYRDTDRKPSIEQRVKEYFSIENSHALP